MLCPCFLTSRRGPGPTTPEYTSAHRRHGRSRTPYPRPSELQDPNSTYGTSTEIPLRFKDSTSDAKGKGERDGSHANANSGTKIHPIRPSLTTDLASKSAAELSRCLDNLRLMREHYSKEEYDEEAGDTRKAFKRLVRRLEDTIVSGKRSRGWTYKPEKILQFCESLCYMEDWREGQLAVTDTYRAILSRGRKSNVSIQEVLTSLHEDYAEEHGEAKRRVERAEVRWVECKKGLEVSLELKQELDECEKWAELTLKLSRSALRVLNNLYPEDTDDDSGGPEVQSASE